MKLREQGNTNLDSPTSTDYTIDIFTSDELTRDENVILNEMIRHFLSEDTHENNIENGTE